MCEATWDALPKTDVLALRDARVRYDEHGRMFFDGQSLGGGSSASGRSSPAVEVEGVEGAMAGLGLGGERERGRTTRKVGEIGGGRES